MIICNKHKTQEIGVSSKFNELIFLKPGEQVEVEDMQGKGYLANYAHILEKVDVAGEVDENKEELIVSLLKQVETLSKLVERLTKGDLNNLGEEEQQLIKKDEDKANQEEIEKKNLIEFLKNTGVKGVGNHWSLGKLMAEKEKIDKGEVQETTEETVVETTEETVVETTEETVVETVVETVEETVEEII